MASLCARLSAIAVLMSAVACGSDGVNGKDATTYLTSAIPASSADCPNGGTAVLIGPDSNGNGQLDVGEIVTTAVVCNGANGQPGKDGSPTDLWLVSTGEADSSECFWGGTLLLVGKDVNVNGTLDVAEVLTITALCNTAVSSGAGKTCVWTGAGADDHWSNAANWQNGLVPASGDMLVFPETAAQHHNQNDLALLTAVTSFSLSGSYDLYGKKLIHNGETTTTVAMVGAPLISLPMELRDSTFTVDDDVPAVDLSISGNLSGVGGVTKGGAGLLELNGDNSYVGPTVINAGTLRSGSANAIPDTSIVSGNFEVSAIGDSIAGLEGSGTLNLLGDLVVGLDNVLHAYDGAATGSGALVKRGVAAQALSGASASHLGALRVEKGTLYVANNWGMSPTTVTAGTLGGTGNIGTLIVSAGAKVAPGLSSAGSGKLTVSGNATLTTATLAVDLNGTTVATQYDRLAATGSVNLGGSTLLVSVGFVPSNGNSFTIVESVSGVTGTFAGLADGATFSAGGVNFSIDYTATTVVLTVVP